MEQLASPGPAEKQKLARARGGAGAPGARDSSSSSSTTPARQSQDGQARGRWMRRSQEEEDEGPPEKVGPTRVPPLLLLRPPAPRGLRRHLPRAWFAPRKDTGALQAGGERTTSRWDWIANLAGTFHWLSLCCCCRPALVGLAWLHPGPQPAW